MRCCSAVSLVECQGVPRKALQVERKKKKKEKKKEGGREKAEIVGKIFFRPGQ